MTEILIPGQTTLAQLHRIYASEAPARLDLKALAIEAVKEDLQAAAPLAVTRCPNCTTLLRNAESV